jgi:hypothetical protein
MARMKKDTFEAVCFTVDDWAREYRFGFDPAIADGPEKGSQARLAERKLEVSHSYCPSVLVFLELLI